MEAMATMAKLTLTLLQPQRFFNAMTIACVSALFLNLAAPPQEALASGADGISYNAFQPETYVPKVDIASYAAGNIGVVPTSYWRIYQMLAYRAFTGNPLSKAEVELLNINGWLVDNSKKTPYFSYEKEGGVNTWLEARLKVKGAAPIKSIGIDASAGNYSSYENCPADAFNRAAQTLKERAKSATEAQLKLWLDGQDAVFKNCDSKRTWETNKVENDSKIALIAPPELPANSDTWLVHDRQYQQAAAHFYAEKFDEARRRFTAIAANNASPWQPFGAHLAARCLVRKATLYYTPNDASKPEQTALRAKQVALLSQARAELLPLAKTYPPAQQLLGFVDGQLRPVARINELGAVLASSKIDAASLQQITDYVFLLTKADGNEIAASKDPMTAWIGLMQAGNSRDENGNLSGAAKSGSLAIARKNWQADKAKAVWLLAVFANASAGNITAEERKAVQSIAESSILYQPLNYELAKMLIAEKKLNDADEIITRVLAKQKSSMIKSTRNRWLGLKVSTAKTQAEFFAALPREHADVEMPLPIPNEGLKTATLLDQDYTDRLYHDFSNADLLALLTAPNFPSGDKNKALKEVIFTRALALGDFATATILANDLATGRATTKHLYDRLKTAPTDEAKRIAAALILVNTPELSTAVFDNQFSQNYRGCDAASDGVVKTCGSLPPNFMSAASTALAQKEQLILRKWGYAEDYLTTTLMAWVKQKPDDVEAPKALHFLISTKRVMGKPSREAFQLLHKLYPASEWAKKTKYYY
jgi:hypothetical protein